MAEELIGNLSSSIVAVGDKFSLLTEPDASENDKQKEFANKFISSWISEQIRKLAFASDISEEECINVWNKTYPDYQIRVRKWHIVEEFQNFEVSNDGLVRNIKTRNYITLQDHYGYYRVRLSEGRERYKLYNVNVLVATYFLLRPEEKKLVVHHINGKPLDNRAENLSWMTYKKHSEEHLKARDYVNEIEQNDLDGKLIKVWKSIREASEILDYKIHGITNECNGGTYKGFVWKYKNERKKKISEEEITEGYVGIGTIKGWDFTGYYIYKDGSKIVGKLGREMEFGGSSPYRIVTLNDANGDSHGLSVHKIINQTLKGGKYEDEMDHKDEVKDNNDLDNLEKVTHRENMIRALGKAVKQINIETGDVVETFRCISDACRKLGKSYCGGDISDVCNRLRWTAYGYGWTWDNQEGDEINSDEVKIPNIAVARRENITRKCGKAVKQ